MNIEERRLLADLRRQNKELLKRAKRAEEMHLYYKNQWTCACEDLAKLQRKVKDIVEDFE
jgi:hypothetical protein